MLRITPETDQDYDRALLSSLREAYELATYNANHGNFDNGPRAAKARYCREAFAYHAKWSQAEVHACC